MNWLRKKVIKWVREDWENAGRAKRGTVIGYPNEPSAELVRSREYQHIP